VYTWQEYTDEVLRRVVISKAAQRDVMKAPVHIRRKLALWVRSVETIGVEAVRKISGYHDEPLHGHRAGQRSIRLSRQWRAIYAVQSDAQIEFIEVQEVNPHDY
jgi:proteic killer suppression protein